MRLRQLQEEAELWSSYLCEMYMVLGAWLLHIVLGDSPARCFMWC